MFVVETDGSVSDVKVAKQVFPSLDAEAIRVVEAMPKWTPGRDKGKVVRVKYNLPIVFRLK
jgi:protein TonB